MMNLTLISLHPYPENFFYEIYNDTTRNEEYTPEKGCIFLKNITEIISSRGMEIIESRYKYGMSYASIAKLYHTCDTSIQGSIMTTIKTISQYDTLRRNLCIEKDVYMTDMHQKIQTSNLSKIYLTELDIDLYPSIFDILRINNITSVFHLLQMTEDDLLSIPKFGKISLNNIKDKLSEFGLKLREIE